MGYSPYQLVLNFCHQQHYLFQHRLAWPSSKKPQTFCVNFIAISHDGCSAAFSGIFRATQISVFFSGFLQGYLQGLCYGVSPDVFRVGETVPQTWILSRWIFLRIRSHGVHHQLFTTIWENIFGTFLKHFHSKIQE